MKLRPLTVEEIVEAHSEDVEQERMEHALRFKREQAADEPARRR